MSVDQPPPSVNSYRVISHSSCLGVPNAIPPHSSYSCFLTHVCKMWEGGGTSCRRMHVQPESFQLRNGIGRVDISGRSDDMEMYDIERMI